jgi:citrate lyase beta subunit
MEADLKAALSFSQGIVGTTAIHPDAVKLFKSKEESTGK